MAPFLPRDTKKGVSFDTSQNLWISLSQCLSPSPPPPATHLPFVLVLKTPWIANKFLPVSIWFSFQGKDLALTFLSFPNFRLFSTKWAQTDFYEQLHTFISLNRIPKNHANPQAYPKFSFRRLSEDATLWCSSALWSHLKSNRFTVPISWI